MEEDVKSYVDSMFSKLSSKITELQKRLEEDIPNTSKFARKENVAEALENLKKEFTVSLTQTNDAVKAIATETETKIQTLTTPKKSKFFDVVLSDD